MHNTTSTTTSTTTTNANNTGLCVQSSWRGSERCAASGRCATRVRPRSSTSTGCVRSVALWSAWTATRPRRGRAPGARTVRPPPLRPYTCSSMKDVHWAGPVVLWHTVGSRSQTRSCMPGWSVLKDNPTTTSTSCQHRSYRALVRTFALLWKRSSLQSWTPGPSLPPLKPLLPSLSLLFHVMTCS